MCAAIEGGAILHSLENDLEAVVGCAFCVPDEGETVQVLVHDVSPQILVHSLVSLALELLLVHHDVATWHAASHQRQSRFRLDTVHAGEHVQYSYSESLGSGLLLCRLAMEREERV